MAATAPSQKPLHQLLQEDQEPFLLNNYIADRRCQLKKPPPAPVRTHLQLKKLRPSSQNFCRSACFFSINNSPDLTKSPIFEFKSPAKSPCNKTPNSIFLHVPAKTAALLLEAAVRIQKQSSAQSSKAKSSNGFGLFGSLLKRITHRKKREIPNGVSLKDILARRKLEEKVTVNADEKSSGVWSESNEDKSWDLDLETSISSQSDDLEERFVSKFIDSNGIPEFACLDDQFCESPFHFVLRRSPSSGHRTPVFASPAASPIRRKTEKPEEELEEEDKDQCSPVSVLDPPFEDDDEGNYDNCQDDGFDLHCSYAFVQRTRQKLLQKLRSFEKLAELDPVELEKRMQEEQEQDDELTEDEEEQEQDIHDMIIEQLGKTSFFRARKIPSDMKRLVSDLITEEESELDCIRDRESMAKRVCKRLEGWKEVESNTIDMMVEEDFKKQVDEWKKYEQQVGEAALEIEVSIFKVLVEELSDELLGGSNEV